MFVYKPNSPVIPQILLHCLSDTQIMWGHASKEELVPANWKMLSLDILALKEPYHKIYQNSNSESRNPKNNGSRH